VTRNAKARCENVCQFIALVVSPLSGKIAAQPTSPPMNDMKSASKINETTIAAAPKPMARIVAISRDRSETAEYMVLSAPKIAPMPITPATRVPSTVMRAAGLFFVVVDFAIDLHLHARIGSESVFELAERCGRG
jgi:hypothetical protein